MNVKWEERTPLSGSGSESESKLGSGSKPRETAGIHKKP